MPKILVAQIVGFPLVLLQAKAVSLVVGFCFASPSARAEVSISSPSGEGGESIVILFLPVTNPLT